MKPKFEPPSAIDFPLARQVILYPMGAVAIDVDAETRVSGLLSRAAHPTACLVLAHGAGAGMEHPFMAAVSRELAQLGCSTLRYQFPYVERSQKRPDPPRLCHATVRAAVAAASKLQPDVPLFAGGKSFGGRMTSQAQAAAPLASVRGLVFLGFPLHPPRQPSISRGEHLRQIDIPLLFLQGTRDEFAAAEVLQHTLAYLRKIATLMLLDGADHSFRVLKRSGRTDAEVRTEMLVSMVKWMAQVVSSPSL